MADNMTGRAERPDLQDNDPFAELTRIMGHDPRQDAAQDAEADLAFDLENELLGTLDLSDDREPEADFTPAAAEAPSWIEELPADPAVQAYPEVSRETVEPASGDLNFADFDAELNAAFETGLDDQPALADEMPVVADEVSEADYLPQAEYRAADEWSDADALPAEADVTAEWEEQEWQEAADAATAMPRADDRGGAEEAALDWSPEEIADDWSADLQAERQPEPEFVPAPEIMAAPEAAPLDEEHFEFDDEHMMALADEPVPHSRDVYEAPEDDAYQAPPAASYEDLADETAADKAPFDDYPVAAEAVEAPKQLSLEEELTMLLAGAEKPRAEPAPAYDVPVASQPLPSRAAEPVVPTPAAVMSRPTWQPRTAPKDEREVPEVETVEMAAFEPIRSAEFDVPDLPVHEPVQTASDFDDLAAELSRAFEVGDEQPEPSGVDPSYGTQRAAEDQQPDFDWDTVVAASGAAAGASQGREPAAHDAYYENDDLYADATGHAPVAEGFAAYPHDDPLADDLPEDRPALRDIRRRNMTIVGGAVAVLLLGGVGVFALWSGGGAGGGEPVLLQADADPVRVRPEEPGGTVVPNQDSEVYQRVAGGREESDPSQTRLIDTAEEPIDLTVQNAPRIVGPDGGGATGFPTDLSAVKAEDRLDAGTDADIASPSDDVIALQPRRVRTMVVRPDGSIVPRDEPAPAAEVQAESATTATPPALEQPTSAESTVPATEPADSEAATETATSMPQEIAQAPAARPEPAPQPPVAVATPPTPVPAPAQQEQQVAAVDPAPVVPQAAQSSEWSMQIASQPSSDSAQATYQDLARRYSSLLEGRGVNIVRAEVDGRTFYRVRIPMASRDEAVNLCTSYQSAGGSCFVSR